MDFDKVYFAGEVVFEGTPQETRKWLTPGTALDPSAISVYSSKTKKMTTASQYLVGGATSEREVILEFVKKAVGAVAEVRTATPETITSGESKIMGRVYRSYLSFFYEKGGEQLTPETFLKFWNALPESDRVRR